jgi:hypothetical protein
MSVEKSDPTTLFTKEYIHEIIDGQTGELLQYKSDKIGLVPIQPSYVKLYLADISYLNQLPKWANGILYELLVVMNYKNEIFLNGELKRRIAEKLNIKPKSIDQALTNFVKQSVLNRIGPSSYRANPWLFGKGKWEDIRGIRLVVEYNLKGERSITADIERGEPKMHLERNEE